MSQFEPKIAAFVCNWCTYAGADLTGTSRIKYAPNVRILRFPCTGRVDFMLLMKAFASGVDGIIVSGCHPNDCHYTSGNFHARRRWIVFKSLLDFIGIDTRRVTFSWVSAAEGAKWAGLVNSFTDEIRTLGPYSEYQQILPPDGLYNALFKRFDAVLSGDSFPRQATAGQPDSGEIEGDKNLFQGSSTGQPEDVKGDGIVSSISQNGGARR